MAGFWQGIDQFLRRFLTPAVRWLLVINVVVFLVYAIFSVTAFGNIMFLLFSQVPSLIVGRFYVWQFVTYMFMHADGIHLICNMLFLGFFAPRLEYRWGTKPFLTFYFITGVGAGVFHFAMAILSGHPASPMLGASGAVYGVLLAYALAWPDDVVYVFGVFPIQVKYLMVILGIIAFIGSAGSIGQGGISHITHLGGIVIALIYLKGGNLFKRRPPGGGGGRRRPRVYQVDPNNHPDFR